ncbi:hypothetical protein ZIOFF_068429 [Zingiber officinale]|uniref:Late embryogenesis abundant protein LEA-2 subgroup domain-containing protein n=1 Tax=Zingiber officinale TaxID=94328 RepID=A0A8J5C7Y9_ZINOF|nr:hypothetical protein ZIOFF_068429 [Zingiber officinale]
MTSFHFRTLSFAQVSMHCQIGEHRSSPAIQETEKVIERLIGGSDQIHVLDFLSETSTRPAQKLKNRVKNCALDAYKKSSSTPQNKSSTERHGGVPENPPGERRVPAAIGSICSVAGLLQPRETGAAAENVARGPSAAAEATAELLLQLPKYSVDRLRISNFTIGPNSTITATFNVTVTARNPNKRIGIYYGDGSHLSSWYNGEQLCAGSFPAFYQGHRNTTVLNVLLTGETQMGSELVSELLQQQQSGMIPLAVRGNVPVRVKFGRLRLRRTTFKVRCALVVNSLTTSSDVSIRSNRCRFRLKF